MPAGRSVLKGASVLIVSLRLKYSRADEAIWLGHLDMMRTFERAVRRAGIPVAYSQGFNPRPRMAFALPIGVGLATEADLLDLLLQDGLEPDPAQLAVWQADLNDSLPAAIQLVDLVLAPPGPSLMSQVRSASYRLKTAGLAEAASRLKQLGEGPWLVKRQKKDKTSLLDIRPLLLDLQVLAPDQLDLHVLAGSSKNLRPDLFLQFLVENCGLDQLAAADCQISRTRLWLG